MNTLFNKLKATVSRDKHRLRTADFDLDLTYITERIIGMYRDEWLWKFHLSFVVGAAMGFPAASGTVESTFRNKIDGI